MAANPTGRLVDCPVGWFAGSFAARYAPGVERTNAIARALLRWFAVQARDLPWRRTRDPYAVWIAEVMLQQTTVAVVAPYFTRWMRELPTARSLAAAPLERVLRLWEGLGYYRRARNLHQAARVIAEVHGGQVPHDFEAVLALPGIGRYTAGAICSIAFNQPRPILDGNVVRVLARLFGIRTDPRRAETREHLWDLATELVRAAAATRLERACGRVNEALMELGAVVCRPRQPRCRECPLRRVCTARKEDLTDLIPAVAKRPRSTAVRRVALVLERAGRFLVQRQPVGAINGGLWEFPQTDVRRGQSVTEALHQLAAARADAFTRLGRIKHSITRYRITIEAYRGTLVGRSRTHQGRWHTVDTLERLPLSRAHRKVAAWLRTNSHGEPPRAADARGRSASPR